MAVKLWAALLRRPLTAEEGYALLHALPPARRERLERLRPRRKWAQALCAYQLLLCALREEAGILTLPDISLTERGKPCFSAFPRLHFSISHTDGAVLCALSDAPVGVDIERIRPVGARLMRRIGAGSDAAFFDAWVRREALLKRSGAGVGALLRPEMEGACGRYLPLSTFEGFAAGVAYSGAQEIGAVCRLDLEELLQERLCPPG